MSLYMETTKIPAEQTVGQIQRLLGAYGASAIMTEYDEGEVRSVSFRIKVAGRDIPFMLPCRCDPIYQVLRRRRKRMNNDQEEKLKDQAKRVAWRQILRWVEAQMAMVDTEMVRIEEVFLPYIQVGVNQTFYDRISAESFKAIEYKES